MRSLGYILVAFSAAWFAAVLLVPSWITNPTFFYGTAALVVINFVVSVTELIRTGRVFVPANIVQLPLIGLLNYQRSRHAHRRRLGVERLEARYLLATVEFGVIGDYGADGPNEQAVADLVKSWNPDFVITVGDNNYSIGEAATIDANIGKQYQEFIGNYTGSFGPGSVTNRFFPALGNHDWLAPGAQPYLDYFDVPGAGFTNTSGNERYYDFVQGPVHFFAIDSDVNEPDGNTSTSTQAQWLEQQLTASTSVYQVVYLHHAPYSSARHGSNATLQWPFQQWGADVVLSGHDHVYERIDVGGLPFFVNGLGGRNIYNFNTSVAGSQFRYNGDYGAMLVTADNSSMTLEFHSVAGGGTLIDTFTIVAASDTTSPTASLSNPLDNGPDDLDSAVDTVTVNTTQTDFQIQLDDINDGVNGATVINSTVTVTKDSVPLVESVDYTFSYDAGGDEITLTSVGGTFGNGDYQISLNSRVDRIADVSGNELVATTLGVIIDTSIAPQQTETYQQVVAIYHRRRHRPGTVRFGGDHRLLAECPFSMGILISGDLVVT